MAIHDGSGVSITLSQDQIIVTFNCRPNRYVRDNLRSQMGLIRRNETDAKQWYRTFDPESWRLIHIQLNHPERLVPNSVQGANEDEWFMC